MDVNAERKMILALLRDNTKGLTFGQIINKCGILGKNNQALFYRAITQLFAEGKISILENSSEEVYSLIH